MKFCNVCENHCRTVDVEIRADNIADFNINYINNDSKFVYINGEFTTRVSLAEYRHSFNLEISNNIYNSHSLTGINKYGNVNEAILLDIGDVLLGFNAACPQCYSFDTETLFTKIFSSGAPLLGVPWQLQNDYFSANSDMIITVDYLENIIEVHKLGKNILTIPLEKQFKTTFSYESLEAFVEKKLKTLILQ